jgi:hypothetical protein
VRSDFVSVLIVVEQPHEAGNNEIQVAWNSAFFLYDAVSGKGHRLEIVPAKFCILFRNRYLPTDYI